MTYTVYKFDDSTIELCIICRSRLVTRSNPSFAFVGREVTEKNKIDILSNVLIQGKNRILPQLTELYCFLVFPEEFELMWSFKRTLHVHRIIARSLRCSISRLLTLGAQHSLAYNKTVRIYVLYICPRVMYGRACEVNVSENIQVGEILGSPVKYLYLYSFTLLKRHYY